MRLPFPVGVIFLGSSLCILMRCLVAGVAKNLEELSSEEDYGVVLLIYEEGEVSSS